MKERKWCRLTHVRRALLLGALSLAGVPGLQMARAEAPALFVPSFDLIEEHPDPSRAADQQRRLEAVHRQFVDGVREHGLYRVVDAAVAGDVLARLRAQHEYLYNCADCKVELGKAAGSQLVAVGWVQKVSNLILNINVEISDATSGRVVLVKSVDIRGNTDETWMRGMRFLLRDLVERRQATVSGGT